MAAQQPVPNVVQVSLTGVVGAINWAHVLHFQFSGGSPTVPVLTSAAQAMFNSYASHIQPLAVAAIVLHEARIADLSSQTGAVGTYTGTSAGSAAGTVIPNNVAFLISKQINRRYRGGHPRAYLLIGTINNLVGSNQWTTAFQSAGVNAYVAFIQAVANGGAWAGIGSEVTVHRTQGHVNLVPPTVDIVQTYSSSPLIASQRRRVGR